MKVTILGSGGATGVPGVARGWGECDPENPKNRRLRPSILVEDGATAVLVDTSPDLRQQLLNADVWRLDAVLFTHSHADHMHGIDDLRPVNRAMNGPLDIYADGATIDAISRSFPYVFEPLAADATMYYKPVLVPHEITGGKGITVGSMGVACFEQDHGYCKTMGFRFGPIAYSTDVVELDDAAFATLEGVDTWIVGVPVEYEHPTHVHLDKALAWIARVRPRRAILSHLSLLMDYETLLGKLPGGIEVAYDGMTFEA